MSHKTRLTKLEKIGLSDSLWALIGIGRPRDVQHQRSLEMQARNSFYASGGNRGAYLAFLPFDSFALGFIGYVKRSQLDLMIANKTKNPAES
ncbi:hypothetical protein [Parachlamydia acanthamoebae]|jgi:hypothetical protein|uniref:hypothetical protein n=1 Tax=Parachlamydia acanthamoebae TaxID=83552 RepID=UPI0024E1BCF9|nr:hypothetical protein [Parachlamydia acanthamoebae]